MTNFRNEPLTDFSMPAAQAGMRRALSLARSQFGRTYPLMINGKFVHTRGHIESINPAMSDDIVGLAADANRSQADQALDAAGRAFLSWRRTSPDHRARLLRKMAHLLRERKAEFSAWLIAEVGKNWGEADADVAEAIDFLEYYADAAEVDAPTLTPVAGEISRYLYQPLGPVVVIPPWNFPLAILVGMTVAAVVTGNTVVLKPSSQSPVIAARFMALAVESGLPAGVINLVSGSGGAIGDYLVGDRRTRMIAFTGSRSVGLRINELASKTAPGQPWIKRVIAEMGGKNAIIVDESADVKAAAQAVLVSAFGYQGQKCSACSRAFVHQSVYAAFRDYLMEGVRRLDIGSGAENYTMGPVISEAARRQIWRSIKQAKRQGRLLSGGTESPLSGGFYVAPTVVERLPESSSLWSEEIFGPVLAIRPVRSFDQAIALANATEYGLTGSVYSTNREHVAQAADDFFCGNLYINRKSTGAWVGGHPFGGFNMSGTNSKAGGPDYLSLFRQAKVVAEKLR